MKTKKNKVAEFITNVIFGLSIISLFLAFNFSDKMNGWYQQFLPNNLPNFQVSDIYFLDSLTGWVVTGNSNPNDTSGYILKTTNAGDNWTLKFTDIRDFSRVKFINENTGFVSGGYFNGARLYKTTNGGENWFSLIIPGGDQIYFNDMSVMNEDTIWVVASESLVGGVFRTTNGGMNWTQQFSGGTENPNMIYMYNERIGFITNNAGGLKIIRKTTDGGLNWSILVSNDSFTDIYFIDSLTGWRTWDYIKKTTDGGLNWINQSIPEPYGSYGGVRKITVINRDTIWGSYPSITFQNTQMRGLLYRTSNGGNNWYYQIPDTSFGISRFRFIQFINKNIGWAYTGALHTINGGDTSFLTSTHQISSEVPNDYKLFQNYPNPFNPVTSIKYQVLRNSNVKLLIYNMTGQEITTLVNKRKSSGTYEVTFDGSNFSSGIYFYSLFIDGKVIDTKKAVLVK